MKKKTIASHDILIVKFVRTALPRGKRGAPSLGPSSLFPGFKILRGDIKSGEHRRRHRNCGYTVFVTVSSSLFIFSSSLLFFSPSPIFTARIDRPRPETGKFRRRVEKYIRSSYIAKGCCEFTSIQWNKTVSGKEGVFESGA